MCKCGEHHPFIKSIEVYKPQNETARYPEKIYGVYNKFKNVDGRPYYQKGKKFAIWCIPQSGGGDHFGTEGTGFWWLGLKTEMGKVHMLNFFHLKVSRKKKKLSPRFAKKNIFPSQILGRQLCLPWSNAPA